MSKGIIFLSGGGDEKVSYELDKEFVSLLDINSKVLYIPHANKKQYPDFSSSLEWLTNTLNNVDSSKDLNIVIASTYEELENISLKDFQSVYIGGGNTYHLLDVLNKTNFSNKLKSFYNNGGIIYGGSAGAIILGKTIETVFEERNSLEESSKGLNLINGYSIVCHANDEIIDRLSNSELKPIIALYEESGLIFSNNEIRSIGKQNKTVN